MTVLNMKFNRKELTSFGVFLAMRDFAPSFLKLDPEVLAGSAP